MCGYIRRGKERAVFSLVLRAAVSGLAKLDIDEVLFDEEVSGVSFAWDFMGVCGEFDSRLYAAEVGGRRFV